MLARGVRGFRARPLTRLRAWWLGVDSAENLERYGDRGFFRRVWMEWRETLLVCGCVFSFLVSFQQSSRANHVLENIELNRQRYYGRAFAPEYAADAPGGVYDGAKGYTLQDDVSGLRVNADNRLATNLSAKEQRDRVEKAEVSDEMLAKAQRLLASQRYQG